MSYLTCPKCNESNPDSAMYCSSCGESLRGAKVIETSTKAYTKSSDIALQKANAGEFPCGLFEKKNGVFMDGKIFQDFRNFLYGDQGATVLVKNDGLHFGSHLFWRGQVAGAVGSANQNMSVMSLLITGATTQTISLDVPWNEMKGMVLSTSNPNHVYLFFNHPKKKRQEWLDIRIGVETSTGVKFESDKELESKSLEILVEKCRAKGIQIQTVD